MEERYQNLKIYFAPLFQHDWFVPISNLKKIEQLLIFRTSLGLKKQRY